MKLYTIKLLIGIGICFIAMGCKKFLDVVPSTKIINPSKIADFQEMLNSDSLAICNFTYADIMSDDAYTNMFDSRESYINAYLWREHIWTASESDISYNSAYKRILQLNITLVKLPQINPKNSPEEILKNNILAQAKVHRAWYYLQLANLYGQDYTSGKSNTNPAVPLVLVPVEGDKPKRATVKEVYDQIIKDLEEAVASPDFEPIGKTIIQPGKAAAHALLARTYLYMANYEKALQEANTCLSLKNELLDFNTLKSYPLSLLDQSKNPEILMGKIGVDDDFRRLFSVGIEGDYDFLKLFDFSDKRKSLAFGNWGTSFLSLGDRIIFNYSVGVPEVMLIKAECLARKKDVKGSLELINKIRKSRIENATDITGTESDILNVVLLERRRELFFHGGLRLFDLKRFNREPALKITLKRAEKNSWSGEVIKDLATLEPNSPRYLMEIAPRIISTNKNIVPNPR